MKSVPAVYDCSTCEQPGVSRSGLKSSAADMRGWNEHPFLSSDALRVYAATDALHQSPLRFFFFAEMRAHNGRRGRSAWLVMAGKRRRIIQR
jgi:hypothetical protein